MSIPSQLKKRTVLQGPCPLTALGHERARLPFPTTLSLFSGSGVDTVLPHSSAGKEATAPQAPLSTEFPRHG